MGDSELRPPALTGPHETGLVIDIVSIGIHNPLPLAGEATYMHVTCADGERYRLPEMLQGWATRMLAEHNTRHAANLDPALPITVEFGSIGHQMFARNFPAT